MLVAFVALSIALGGQDLGAKITLEYPAARMEGLLDQLSKQAGVRLVGSSVTKPLIITAKFNDCSVRAAMDKIAWATHAEWVSEPGLLRLTRTPKIEKQIRAELLETRRQNAIKALARLRAEVEKEDVFDSGSATNLAMSITEMQKTAKGGANLNWQAYTKLKERAPSYRAARKIALLMSAEELASIAPRQRLVLSPKPTKMQRQFKPDLQPILSQLVRDQNLLASAAVKAGFERKGDQWMWEQDAWDVEMAIPSRVLIASTPMETSGGYDVSVIFADDKGRITSQPRVQITAENPPQDFFQKEDPLPGEQLVVVPPIVAEVTGAISGSGQVDIQKLSTQTIQTLSDTDKNEPIELMCATMLRSAVKSPSSMVAVLPDIAVVPGIWLSRLGQPSLRRLLSILGYLQIEVENKPDWLALRPVDPFDVEASQVDRVDLAKIAARVVRRDLSTLDERVRIAKVQRTMGMNLYMMWGMLLGENPDFEDVQALQVYGTLDSNQLLLLKNHGTIPFGRLRTDQQRLLTEQVFGSRGRLTRTYEAEVVADGESPSFAVETLVSEPTEALPNGIPASSPFTAEFVDEVCVFGVAKTDGDRNYDSMSMARKPLSANDLAWRIHSKERPDLYPWAAEQSDIQEFRVGRHFSVSMSLKLSDKLLHMLGIDQPSYDPKAPPVPLAKLPAEFRKQFDDAIKSYRAGSAPPPSSGEPPRSLSK